MRSSTMLRLFFVLYCFEAGLLLLFAPWSPEWDRIVMQLPLPDVRTLLLHPGFRGAVTGFGLVHLVWGTHDLLGVILRRDPPPLPQPAMPPPLPQAPDVQTAGDVQTARDQ